MDSITDNRQDKPAADAKEDIASAKAKRRRVVNADIDTIYTQVVGELAKARYERNVSLSQLARMTRVERSYISKVENGQTPNVGLKIFLTLCDALGVRVRIERKETT